MATQENTFKMGLQADQLKSELERIVQGFGKEASAIENVVRVSQKFNAEGQVVAATIRAQVTALGTLTVAFDKLTAAQKKAGDTGSIAATQANEALRTKAITVREPKQTKQISTADFAASESVLGQVRQQFPIPSSASVSQIIKYNQALQTIQNTLVKGSVTAQRFNEIMGALQSKSLSKLNLGGDEIKVVKALQDISQGFNVATEASKKFSLTWSDAFRIGQALLFKEFIGFIIGQLQQAVREAVKFQIAISEIRTLATENQSSFEAWSGSMEKVSNRLGIPQIEVAKAAYEGLSAQIVHSREEAEQFTTAAGNLARVGVSSITASGQVLASVFNAYGIHASRAEEISAKLFVAVDRGNFTIEQLGSHLGRVTGAASAMGIKFEEMLGALTTLSRTSNPADSITQLTNVILKLQKPGDSMKGLLKSWGFESGQAAINALGFVGVLNKLQIAVQGDAAALAEFGQELRAIRGLTGLTQGGKGAQFAADVAALQGDAIGKFREAQVIRGESPADRMVREFTEVKNFFTNEFGQTILRSVASVTDSMGGMANAVKVTTNVVGTAAKTVAVLVVGLKLASVTTNLFTGGMARLGFETTITTRKLDALGMETGEVEVKMTKTGKAANLLGAALKAVAIVGTFAVLLKEIKDYAKSLDETLKKSEEFERIMSEISAARLGKTVTGESVGAELFRERMVKDAQAFSNVVDRLYQPQLQREAQISLRMQENLKKLKEEGKETATQLEVAFSGVTDSINKTVSNFTKKITDANNEIKDTAKNIMGIKDTVQSLIFDLKNEFANEAQQFQLRRQEIERLEREGIQLMQTGTTVEEIDRGRKLFEQGIRLRKEDASARGKAQQAAGQQVSLSEDMNNIKEAGRIYIELQKDIERRMGKQSEELNKQLEKEKERERLLKKRIEDFIKLQVINESGDVKKDFLGEGGKFDENKFRTELKKQMDQINATMTEEERKVFGITKLREVELNLLKQARAEAELVAQARRQTAIAQEADQKKREFDAASKERIEASQAVEQAGKEFAFQGDVVKTITGAVLKDSSWKTFMEQEGKGGNLLQQAADGFLELGGTIVFGIEEAMNKVLPGKDIPHSELDAIAKENKPLIDNIQDASKKFADAAAKVTARDARGKLIGTEADIDAAKAARANLNILLNQLIGKIRPELTGEQRDRFAPRSGGANILETRARSEKAFDEVINAFQREKRAVGKQEQLVSDLRKSFTPAEYALAIQTDATRDLIDAMVQNTTNLANFSTIIATAAANMRPQLNVPATPSGNSFQKRHSGGLIHGPAGYDNIPIWAEAGEFVVNQTMTKKWLPQLIAMNQGRSPKIPGQYHEGGLVQTNVGDVNVTITGPVSPDKNVRQIGNALRRSIRRGNLDLTSKR